MSKKIESTLIILTRNEIDGLRAMIGKIPFNKVDEHYLIDFQSSDGTIEFAKMHNLNIIHQSKPGRGEAFKIAAKKAKGKYLIFFSPDGNEDPKDIPKIITQLKKGHDLVIASRFLPKSRNEEDDQLLKFRAWANQAFTFIANFIWNRGNPYITDTINGYRGITKSAFNKLNLNASGYVIEYQISIRAMKQKLNLTEIPTIEGNRIGGESNAKSIPTGIKFLKFLYQEITNPNQN